MDYKTLYAFNGIQRQVSPFLTQDGDLFEAQNVTTEKIGVLKKSFDYTIKGTQITPSQSIYGGIDFQRNNGTHEHLIAINGASNAEIYKYVTDWTTQSQTLTKDYRIRFAYSPTIDTLFACNYADATRSYSTSWSTTTNVTNAPKAKYILSFGDRVYLLNCKVGSDEYPSRAYRCDAIETSATWDSSEYVVFNDVITGVGMNAESMFVACQNSTHIFTLADEKYQVSTIGCVSHESIAQHSRYTFYAARDGYYCYDGRDTFKISSPVQDYWKMIPESSLGEIQAVVDGDHIYVYIGSIDTPWESSETLDNVILDYNVLQNNWNRGRLSTGCTHLHTYVTTLGRKVFMGSSDGEIYQMFDGSGQQNGADYASHFETPWIYGSGAGILDDYTELWGYGDYLSGHQVLYKCEERDNWEPIGELNEDTDVVKFKIRAYKVRFRLQEFSGKNLYEISRIDVGYAPAYEKHEDRTRE
jgi:hypothetical protein